MCDKKIKFQCYYLPEHLIAKYCQKHKKTPVVEVKTDEEQKEEQPTEPMREVYDLRGGLREWFWLREIESLYTLLKTPI